MYNNFDLRISKILKNAEKEMQELNHPYVGSEHLLLAILNSNDEIVKILNKYGLNYKNFKQSLINVVGKGRKKSEVILYTPLLKRAIENAINDSEETTDKKVTSSLLFLGLLEEGEGIAIRLMLSLNVEIDKLYKELKNKKNKKENLLVFEIGTLLNDNVDLDEIVVDRNEEINTIIETLLRKNKNNPLLIGKSGVGKTAIVEELTRKIIRNDVPKELLNKKIVSLEMSSLIAGTKYRGEFEERLSKIIKEIKSEKDIILFIDEIHTLIGAGGAEGAIDASNILKPYLARGEIKCIGATTTEEYNKFIAKEKALDRRFQIIDIKEPNNDQTKNILIKIKKTYEKHHGINITIRNINDIVELSQKYIFNRNNPDKCIDVLDSVCAKVKVANISPSEYVLKNEKLKNIISQKEKEVLNNNYKNAINLKNEEEKIKKDIAKISNNKKNILKKDILKVISEKTNIPLLNSKNNLLLNLKTALFNKIYGQKSAIQNIMDVLKLNLYKKNKPISFLFTGTSGIGKTETAKIIAKTLTNNNLVRIDMSEYNLDISVNKLIGVSSGYVGYDDEPILSKVRRNPFSVILLDEIEKASSQVLNLFLQILDEGFITDNKGEQINFNNCIIIMTSNIVNNRCVGFNESFNNKIKECLSPELINRLDKIIQFQTFDEETIRKYIKGTALNICDKDIDFIIKNSNYEEYGLRNINRYIEKYNNNLLTI